MDNTPFKGINIKDFKNYIKPEIFQKRMTKKQQENFLQRPDIPMTDSNGFKKIDKLIDILNGHTKNKVEKLQLYDIGYLLNCHRNSALGSEFLNNFYKTKRYQSVKGFIFARCKCGVQVIAEIHSVIKDTETNILYDITPDYCDGIKTRYFKECDFFTQNYEMMLNMPNFDREYDIISSFKEEDYMKGYCSNHFDDNVKKFLFFTNKTFTKIPLNENKSMFVCQTI